MHLNLHDFPWSGILDVAHLTQPLPRLRRPLNVHDSLVGPPSRLAVSAIAKRARLVLESGGARPRYGGQPANMPELDAKLIAITDRGRLPAAVLPRGPDELRRAAAVALPVDASGGVTINRLPEVAAAGARGAAGISVFPDSARLAELVTAADCLFV